MTSSATRVAGYRAPYFLSRARDLWAIDVLAELGLRYDASYVPVRWMPYLGRSIPRVPYRHPCGVWEFPLPFAERFGGLEPAVRAAAARCCASCPIG